MATHRKHPDFHLQLLQKLILSTLVGILGYFLVRSNIVNLNIINSPYWTNLMYLLVAVGLYLNVVEIELKDISYHWKTLVSILLFGLPIKIFLPGIFLGLLYPNLWSIVFLCSTVIAQIDPIAASHNLKSTRLNPRTKIILRFWSSFDDPITVLFAFYIFLPFTLYNSSFSVINYFINLSKEFIICGLIYYLYQIFKNRTKTFKDSIINFFDLFFASIITLLFGFSGSFLVPATTGLIIRPNIPSEISESILSFIFYFSVLNTGIFISSLGIANLNWTVGIILGGVMFLIAQPIVTFIFVNKVAKKERLRIMFCHENGMTAILLTVAIELSNKDLSILSITLPAIICISALYLVVNSYLNYLFPFHSKSKSKMT